jgi:hypothetical protein
LRERKKERKEATTLSAKEGSYISASPLKLFLYSEEDKEKEQQQGRRVSNMMTPTNTRRERG